MPEREGLLDLTESIAEVQILSREHKNKLYYGFLYNFSSPNTRKAYLNDLKRFLQFLHHFFPGLDELKVEHAHMVAFKDHLAKAQGIRKEKIGGRAINRTLAGLWSFYQYLFDQGMVKDNPVRLIKRFKVPHEVKTTDLSDEQVRQLMEAVDGRASSGPVLLHRAVLSVLFTTGMRHRELSNMRFKNLVYENKFVVFRYRAKGDKEMITPLNPRAEEALGEYLQWCQDNAYTMNPDDFLFRPTNNPHQSGFLNKALDAKAVNYMIKKYAKKIGVKGRVTVHSARSTVIGMLLDKGLSIDKVADFVGHKDMGTTRAYNKRKSKIGESLSFQIDI